MSACSVAVGVLSIIAVVHFAITIALGVLIAVVCYYGKRKKVAESENKNSITYGVEDVDSAPVHVYDSTAAAVTAENVYDEIQHNETPEKIDLGEKRSEEADVHITNPWASSSQDDLLEGEDIKKEDLRRESLDKPKGLDFKRTDSPRSPLGEDGPRRRSRISIASITNTIFHRKSVDMGCSDDTAAKQLMGNERDSSTGPSDDGVSSTERLDEAAVATTDKDHDTEKKTSGGREGYKTSMTLTFDFPSFSPENESTC